MVNNNRHIQATKHRNSNGYGEYQQRSRKQILSVKARISTCVEYKTKRKIVQLLNM